MKKQPYSAFIWAVDNLLRSDYRQAATGKFILWFIVLHHLDCLLEPTKAPVLSELSEKTWQDITPSFFSCAERPGELLQPEPDGPEEAPG